MDLRAYRTVPRGDDIVLLWRPDPYADDLEVHRWTETGCAGAPGPALADLLRAASRHAAKRPRDDDPDPDADRIDVTVLGDPEPRYIAGPGSIGDPGPILPGRPGARWDRYAPPADVHPDRPLRSGFGQ